jgi:pimeloyl-ACP methyl ester carboxylesterase
MTEATTRARETRNPETHTLDVPGAVLTYDVRPSETSAEPPLMIIGSPMAAAGFVTLAGHFPDRTVVTYDPRGADRSPKTEPLTPSTPDKHADDIHRVIAAVGGSVDLFATSGGAVNALALVARHPGDVRTLVAHEPPTAHVLPDREQALAACIATHELYLRRGFGPAMAKFIALASLEGPIPDDFADQPGPDPQMFGLPTEDDGSRSDPLLGQNMPSCNAYAPDFDALRTAPTRIVVAVGTTSARVMAGRAAIAVAERLGIEPVTFPGGHDGFLGGEYGGFGEPDAFAAKLREVLEAES